MDEGIAPSIGQRLREIRVWRGLSLRAAAGLAGFSASYLSMIENGKSPVDKRSTLEAFASALRVAPSELTGVPMAGRVPDPEVSAAEATVTGIETVLTSVGFGDVAVRPRAWPEVADDLQRLNERLRPAGNYAGQGALLPGLIMELQALVCDSSAPRAAVLVGLIECYHSVVTVTRNLGVRGLPALAAWHARRVAEELDDPAWLGLAEFLRVFSIGGDGRERMCEVALQGAAALEPHLSDVRARQMYGALHLQASLSAAALRQPDTAAAHLDEADGVARSLEVPTRPGPGFGSVYFGLDNVGIWRVSIAVELGEFGWAREAARGVVLDHVPSAARQACYWSDLGRSMAARRSSQEDAVRALRRAEDIAAVWVRTQPLVRETVADLLRRARRDAAGRELRGMSFRMGIAG